MPQWGQTSTVRLAVLTTSLASRSFLFHSVAVRGGTGFTGAVSDGILGGRLDEMLEGMKWGSCIAAKTGCAAKGSDCPGAWAMDFGSGAAKGYIVSCIGGRWAKLGTFTGRSPSGI